MKKDICIVIANYYPDVSKDLLKGALKVLRENSIKNYRIINSPGIFEIPVIIARNIKFYNAFVALGCVIKGKTPHFNLISKATFNAVMNLSVEHKKPIGMGIISCLNKKQAFKRSNPQKRIKEEKLLEPRYLF